MRKMKKVLATMLAATMVASMSLTAFADETPRMEVENELGNKVDVEDHGTVTIKKNYEDISSSAFATANPEETFTFTIDWDNENPISDAASGVNPTADLKPKITNVFYSKGDQTREKNITITLPTYTSVGVYKYIITENAGTTAGVGYYDNEIELTVTVIQDDSGKLRVAAVHTQEEDLPNAENSNYKLGEFSNTYNAAGLTVTKEVTGNLGDRTKEFDMTVVFTAPKAKDKDGNDVTDEDGNIVYLNVNSTIGYTLKGNVQAPITFAEGATTKIVEFSLPDGESAIFNNIPKGVTYTVVEDTYSDYTTTYKLDDATATSIESEICEENDSSADDVVIITNDKTEGIDTGIILDSAPYVLLLALAAVGMFAVVSNKREDEI